MYGGQMYGGEMSKSLGNNGKKFHFLTKNWIFQIKLLLVSQPLSFDYFIEKDRYCDECNDYF